MAKKVSSGTVYEFHIVKRCFHVNHHFDSQQIFSVKKIANEELLCITCLLHVKEHKTTTQSSDI